MKGDILTITLNPALDLGTFAEGIAAGPKIRCAAPTEDPGGGGINVARVISRLGGEVRAMIALGGPTGARLAKLMAAEGLMALPIAAPGETRISFAVTDRQTGGQFRFVLPGPVWTASEVEIALGAIVGAAADSLVVLSGSQPPGVPDNFGATLATRLAAEAPDARLIADTSGGALGSLARGTAALDVLRMDAHEAEILANRPLPERSDSAAFAAELAMRGAARHVVIARGADGSVLAGKDGCWHAMAADVPVRSRIGAGDSFVGAMAFAMAEGQPMPQALQLGAAAASATVTSDATELCDPDLVRALVPDCALTRMPDP